LSDGNSKETRAVSPLRGAHLVLALAACAGCSTFSSPAEFTRGLPASRGRPLSAGAYIKHVVVIIQENRTFDNFFSGYPGADAPTFGCAMGKNDNDTIAPTGTTGFGCPPGQKQVPLRQSTFQHESNLPHSFEAAIVDWHNGHMDGFSHWGRGANLHTAAYEFIERSQVTPYWTMAQQYVLADRMFPTEFGPSWTAHLTLVAGTDNLNPKLALADFATGKSNCRSQPGSKTTTVDSKRVVRHSSGPYPCLNQFNTMAEVLDTAGVSWKYYVSEKHKAFIWSPFAAIQYVYSGQDWDRNIILPQTQVLSDIANNNLASVSWVTPSHNDSDHPGGGSDKGPSWVSSIVNAIGQSSYWDSTAIVVVWDDWGGFYDDATPPQLDFRGLGFRVPCLIISPYAKHDVVVHTQYEFGSIIKFMREVFNLPPLGATADGYTDTRANSISDSFDFTHPARRFTVIKAKYPAEYFLHEPPSDEPVDDE
jgi:phospholipase C